MGHFELFVPDGPARVFFGMPGSLGYLREVALTVPADRDPEPIQVAIDDQRPAVIARRFRPVACDVRVRLRADAGEGRPPAEGRTLSGRVFDSDGSPIVGLRLYCSKDRTLVDCATDRLGVFRFKDLPPGRSRSRYAGMFKPAGSPSSHPRPPRWR